MRRANLCKSWKHARDHCKTACCKRSRLNSSLSSFFPKNLSQTFISRIHVCGNSRWRMVCQQNCQHYFLNELFLSRFSMKLLVSKCYVRKSSLGIWLNIGAFIIFIISQFLSTHQFYWQKRTFDDSFAFIPIVFYLSGFCFHRTSPRFFRMHLFCYDRWVFVKYFQFWWFSRYGAAKLASSRFNVTRNFNEIASISSVQRSSVMDRVVDRWMFKKYSE